MNGKDDDMPAQVLRVVWRNPLAFWATPTTYFTMHERFDSASIVLSDRVHLLSITSKAATFTEVDRDILNAREHSFTCMAQTNHTKKLIILPSKVFYDLVDKIDVTDRNVVWMLHTTRCGSTAWVQAFNALPGWTTFAEPQAMLYSIMYGDHGHHDAESLSKTEEFKRLAVAYIKIHIRHAPKNGSVFWKGTTFDEHLADIIAANFPKHKMLVAYRDPAPALTSFYNSFNNVGPIKYVTEVLLNHDPNDDDWWFRIPNTNGWTNGCDHKLCKKIITRVRPRTSLEWFTFLWAAKTSKIRALIQDGAKIKPIKYDSLLANRTEIVAKVFDYLGIATENIDLAYEALNSDSQAGIGQVSWVSRKTGGRTVWKTNEEIVRRCNMILEEFALSDVDTQFDLPDSL